MDTLVFACDSESTLNMKKILSFFSGGCLMLAIGTLGANPVHAEDWFFLAESDVDVKFFLDRESMSRKGNVVEVKTFEVYRKPEDDGSVAAIVRREYQCSDKKSRVQQVSALFNDGSMRVYKETSTWEAINANSVDALIWNRVCGSP